jgi:NAD(P)H-flavin reductase
MHRSPGFAKGSVRSKPGAGLLAKARYIGRRVSERATEPVLSATLVARRDLAPQVVLLRFRMDAGQQLIWAPGQYLTLSTADAPATAIPYSIASAPEPSLAGEFELAVSTNGGQELLARLQLGTRVLVSNPQGRFVWVPARGATLLIGMGTGLAPLRAILQASLAHEATHPIGLLFGVRSEADILWHEEFTRLAERNPRFSFEPTLSRPGSAWLGRSGRVQEHLAQVLRGLPEVSVYLCGSRAMVEDCIERLNTLGVDPARIRSEAH